MSRISSFVNHFITAKRLGHGVHSPFVYDLATKVIADKREHIAYKLPEIYFDELRNTSQTLEHIELGAGQTNNKKLKVSEIANRSAVTPKWGRLLHRLVRFAHPSLVVELGTSLGVGSLYMASALDKSAKLFTYEGSPQIAAFAEQNFERMKLSDTITVFNGNIDDKLPQTEALIDKIDFAFIDANHKFTPTIKYFSWLAEKSHDETIIVLDDIHWSKEMELAWLEVQNMPGVTITIDLYRFGLVFFKKDQAREHFKIWV